MDFTKPWIKVESFDTMLGPNGDSLMSPVTIAKDDLEKALKKEGVILSWGTVEYSDIFESTVIHSIEFCFTLNPTTNTNTGKLGVVPTPYRNDCNINK